MSNSNPSSVRIGSLTLDITQAALGFGVDAGHSGCDTSALGFNTQTNAGVGWVVPAKTGATNGTLQVTLTAALSMSVDAANACQGADFSVFVSAGP